MKRIAIFVSGSGTNMENIAKKVQSGELPCKIVTVVCDNPNAPAIERAAKLDLNIYLIDRKNFKTKVEYEAQITEHLSKNQIDLVVLAGYMKILGPEIVKAWEGKMINIHPSLLPKHPGAHAIKDAFDAKDKETGVTVHWVIEDVDAGPQILQRAITVKPNDTLASLEARVHEVEYQIYPEAIKLVLSGKAQFKK